jgi:uncharacterized protein (DUF1501 family)
MKASRRHFMQAVAALAGTAPACCHAGAALATGLAGLGTLASHATTRANEPYRALVCVFLRGGSDGHNWIVPTDPEGYAAYRRARGVLAIAPGRLRELATAPSQPPGRRFAMPVELAPLQALYERGDAAVIANVGQLQRPLTRAQALATDLGANTRHDHERPSLGWQTLSTDPAAPGWGGRMGEILMSANDRPAFTTISFTGDPVYLAGHTLRPLRVRQTGATDPRIARALGRDGVAEASALLGECLDREAARIELQDGANPSPISLAGDPLVRQLATVARIISTHEALGVRRQIFMVSADGFDTHHAQARTEPELMTRLAHALGWFWDTIGALGRSPQVALFTASEFGRTLAPQGDGSDHGWGNHHLVIGGGLRGGDIVGRFPDTALGVPEDLGAGRLLPTTSVSQLAATLGRWMGLSDSEMLDVLPGLDAMPSRTLPLLPEGLQTS